MESVEYEGSSESGASLPKSDEANLLGGQESHEGPEFGKMSLEMAALAAAVEDGVIVESRAGKGIDAIKSKSKVSTSLRRGKWTSEEENYANKLIQDFKSGVLPIPEGTTLRTFLSKLLNCDPMRISKKFVGQNCIGKQMFKRTTVKISAEEQEKNAVELAELEKKFIDRISQLNRSKHYPAQSPKNNDNTSIKAGYSSDYYSGKDFPQSRLDYHNKDVNPNQFASEYVYRHNYSASTTSGSPTLNASVDANVNVPLAYYTTGSGGVASGLNGLLVNSNSQYNHMGKIPTSLDYRQSMSPSLMNLDSPSGANGNFSPTSGNLIRNGSSLSDLASFLSPMNTTATLGHHQSDSGAWSQELSNLTPSSSFSITDWPSMNNLVAAAEAITRAQQELEEGERTVDFNSETGKESLKKESKYDSLRCEDDCRQSGLLSGLHSLSSAALQELEALHANANANSNSNSNSNSTAVGGKGSIVTSGGETIESTAPLLSLDSTLNNSITPRMKSGDSCSTIDSISSLSVDSEQRNHNSLKRDHRDMDSSSYATNVASKRFAADYLVSPSDLQHHTNQMTVEEEDDDVGYSLDDVPSPPLRPLPASSTYRSQSDLNFSLSASSSAGSTIPFSDSTNSLSSSVSDASSTDIYKGTSSSTAAASYVSSSSAKSTSNISGASSTLSSLGPSSSSYGPSRTSTPSPNLPFHSSNSSNSLGMSSDNALTTASSLSYVLPGVSNSSSINISFANLLPSTASNSSSSLTSLLLPVSNVSTSSPSQLPSIPTMANTENNMSTSYLPVSSSLLPNHYHGQAIPQSSSLRQHQQYSHPHHQQQQQQQQQQFQQLQGRMKGNDSFNGKGGGAYIGGDSHTNSSTHSSSSNNNNSNSNSNSVIGSKNIFSSLQEAFNSPLNTGSASTSTGTPSSAPTGRMVHNSSVENFWLLVNCGDIPRPDSGVLSEILWQRGPQGSTVQPSHVSLSSHNPPVLGPMMAPLIANCTPFSDSGESAIVSMTASSSSSSSSAATTITSSHSSTNPMPSSTVSSTLSPHASV